LKKPRLKRGFFCLQLINVAYCLVNGVPQNWAHSGACSNALPFRQFNNRRNNMSISKLIVTGIALAALSGSVSQAVAAAPHHVKKLHFSVQGVAGSEAGEGNEAGENEGNEGAESQGSDNQGGSDNN
jgi:ABC-type Fe3+-siderophore transport system permease subunit